MNAWAAVDLAMLPENLLDFSGKGGIFSAMLRHFAVFPGRIAALGNLKRLAEHRDQVFVTMLGNELELHSWPREKMPLAFFPMSRSGRSNSFSRFQWRI